MENGNVTLTRGGTEVVRIIQKPAASTAVDQGQGLDLASLKKLIEPTSTTDDASKMRLWLPDAIKLFNEEQSKSDLGRLQPPLTDDEVIASLLWTQDSVDKSLSDEEQKKLKSIYLERVLPAPFRFTVLTELLGADKERFKVWFIQLTLTRPDGTEFRHNIREQFLSELDEKGNDRKFAYPAWVPPEGSQKLDDVIKTFNERHGRLGGINMPPVTMEEVMAAIRFWKTQRPKFDVTNTEFDQLQEVASLGYLPPGAELSIITHFEPGDGRKYLIWSLRLHLKKLEAGGQYPMFGDVFRTHYVNVCSIDEGKIAWGPVAKSGIQAGVLFESTHGIHGSASTSESSKGGGPGADRGGKSSSRAINATIALETQITPTFYFRNTADKHKEASFPNIMTHSYYKKLEATLASGKQLPVETNKDPAGPVGWIQMPFAFGAQHEIRGLPILLGEGDRGDAESAIRASSGQSIRVRFTLDNYGDPEGEPVMTDWVSFSVE